MGARAQGRLAPETWRRSEDHASVPRLWRHVYGALPQHHARRQRDALEVGDRRWWPAVPATAANSAPHTAGSHGCGPDRHTSDRFRLRPKVTGQGETNMNTQVNIKARRLLYSPAFVTLSVAVVVMLATLVVGGPSVQAQTADPVIVDSSITIATNGTVNDPGGAVLVSGSVTI